MDEASNMPPSRKVQGDSPLAKVCLHVIEAIRFIAENTDRELAGKIVAVVIALGYAVAIVVICGGVTRDALSGCAFLLVPLGLIWFPEEIGGFTGYVSRGGHIDNETPPFFVSFMGWMLLVGLPVAALFLG